MLPKVDGIDVCKQPQTAENDGSDLDADSKR